MGLQNRILVAAAVLALGMTACAKRETIELGVECSPGYPGRTEEVLARAVRVSFSKYPGRSMMVTSPDLAARVAGGEENFLATIEVVRYRRCILPSHIVAIGGIELGDGGWGQTLLETETPPPGWCDQTPLLPW